MSALAWCPRALLPTTGRTPALALKPLIGAEPFTYAAILSNLLSSGGICGLTANKSFVGNGIWHVHMICLLNLMAAVFQGALLLLYKLSLLADMSLEQAVM